MRALKLALKIKMRQNESAQASYQAQAGDQSGDQNERACGETKLQKALGVRCEAAQILERTQTQQIEARQAIRQIKKNYHPYDLQTGKIRTAAQVLQARRNLIS